MKKLLIMLLLFNQLAIPALADPLWTMSEADKQREPWSMAKGFSSFVVPGVGQAFNDDLPKAYVHLGLTVVLLGAFFLPGVFSKSSTQLSDGSTATTYSLAFPGLVLSMANVMFHLYSSLDAYQVSDQLKKKDGEPF